MLAKIWGVQKNYHFRHTAIWSLKLIGPFLNPTRAAFYSFQASICSMTKVVVFLDASSQRILFVFFNLDPSLNSHNSGSKNHSNRNHHIFRKPWTSASRWHSVCVCVVLVHYGPFPHEINGKSVKLAVWAVSLTFLFYFTLLAPSGALVVIMV